MTNAAADGSDYDYDDHGDDDQIYTMMIIVMIECVPVCVYGGGEGGYVCVRVCASICAASCVIACGIYVVACACASVCV